MLYSRLKDIKFSWTYDQIMSVPIFMKEQIYQTMDEFIEEENKAIKAMNEQFN